MDTRYLTVAQVADRLSTSTATIWRWVRNGSFPRPVKLSPGCTRWQASALEAFVSQREAAA